MKVLVLSPEKKDKASRKRRGLIVRALEDLKAKLLNPLPGRPPRDKMSLPSLFPQIFYEKETQLVNKADLVIADLTDPDFKIGALASKALEEQKPVLGLFWEAIDESKLEAWRENQFLFVECFDKENVSSVLRNFLKFIRQRQKKRGKLIVIDGIDGSGKATQSELLLKYLRRKKYRVKYIDFPRYYSSFHGGMVSRYLSGEFGGIKEVNPYLASLTYALDRLTAKEEMEDWLRTGNIVIANRYASSSMAHQTARVEKSEREKFLNWLMKMEYRVHKIPKEDLVIFLCLPVKIGQKLVDKKKARRYISGIKRDIHEASLDHLKEAGKMYLYLVKKMDNWVKINCLGKGDHILPPQKVHQKIVEILEKRGIIGSD